MAEEARGRRKWLLRLCYAYIVCAALLFGVTWILLMGWRDVVPGWLFAINFGAASIAAVVGHFLNGRDNWPESWD